MGAVVNELARQEKPILLALDDYHLIQNNWIQQALTFLIEHQPPRMTLIIVTRTDPALPLARLRGRGYVSEIRDAQLRFTQEEALQFLNEIMQLDLSRQTAAALETQTEGWIVGLQMAALSLQGRVGAGARQAFVDAFRGTNRYILDYLMEEVLGQQTAEVKDFLLETAILQRMCGPLCAALRADQAATMDSQAMLTHLERANLFVVPLDDERRWYRTHHLFADLLLSTLRQERSAAEIRELHRRASLWHQAQNHLEAAMIHALAAKDYERAAAMIDENIASMLARSEAPVLLAWIEKLPPEIASDRPWVDIYRAYTLALSGQAAEADQIINAVERRIDEETPRFGELAGQIAAIRSFTANMQGDAARVMATAARVNKNLPPDHFYAHSMTAYVLSDTYFAQDDMARAGAASQQMLAIGAETGRLLLSVTALCDLALIRKAEGRLREAHELYQQAYELMAGRQGLDSRVRCPYEVGMADLLLEWNELEQARDHAQAGIAYGQRFNIPSLLTYGNLTQMRLFLVQDELDKAQATLQAIERFTAQHPLQMKTHIAFNTARVQFWLAAGDLNAAQRWARACDGGSELEQITLARLRLAKGDHRSARRLLERQQAAAAAGRRTGRLLEILLLRALLQAQEKEMAAAGETLWQALSLAQPEGYMRLFMDGGQPLLALLRRTLAGRDAASAAAERPAILRDYAKEILAAVEQEQGQQDSEPALPEPLTEREMEVLRLLAEGISNKEIAARLVVAPSTVKQHLKHIYGKLDVHSRVQAVSRGRELGLI